MDRTRMLGPLALLLFLFCSCNFETTGNAPRSKGYLGERCGSHDLVFAPPPAKITGNEMYRDVEYRQGVDSQKQLDTANELEEAVPVSSIVTEPRSDGYPVTPMDILSIKVSLELGARSSESGTALAVAEITFMVPEAAAFPVFDLRQTVTKATIDGKNLDTNNIRHLAVSAVNRNKPEADFASYNSFYNVNHARVLQRTFDPCSVHKLVLHYDAAKNEFDASNLDRNKLGTRVDRLDPLRPAPGFYASLSQGSTVAGFGLGQWMPENLPFDRFPIELDIKIESEEAYSFLSNCSVQEQGDNQFEARCPEDFLSHYPFFGIYPAEMVGDRRDHNLADSEVTLDLLLPDYPRANQDRREKFVEKTQKALSFFENRLSPYPHGSRFLFIEQKPEAVRYGNSPGVFAGVLSSINRGVCRQWFGKSVLPASGRDSWIQNTICDHFNAVLDTTLAYGTPRRRSQLNRWNSTFASPANGARPKWIASESLWHRTSFGGLGFVPWLIDNEVFSVEQFERIAALIAKNKAHSFFSTEEFEAYLYCNADEKEKHRVERAFKRHVYEGGERVFERPACTEDILVDPTASSNTTTAAE